MNASSPAHALERVLIANRGEIAIRIARAAAELGIESVAVYSADDADSLHVVKADRAVALEGTGAGAYLDADAIVAAATAAGCDCLHPGYDPERERGPGLAASAPRDISSAPRRHAPGSRDKTAAGRWRPRRACRPARHPTRPRGTVRAFVAVTASVIKGGRRPGGRGMRVVRPGRRGQAFARAASEAEPRSAAAALCRALHDRCAPCRGAGTGDGSDAVHLGQRTAASARHQKLIEIAPAPGLPERSGATCTRALKSPGLHVPQRGPRFEFMVDNDIAAGEARLRLHRGESALQIGTHRDRGSDGRRPVCGRSSRSRRTAACGLDARSAPRASPSRRRVRLWNA